MLHLFDANVLITANNTYLAIDQVGEYWDWIQYQGEIGNIKIPAEIMEEILAGKNTKKGQKNEDLLLPWIKQPHVKKALLLDEKVDPALVAETISKGYAPDLKDTELEVIGRDPFIVAYARAKSNRCVVSVETSAPSKKRQNRKVPDVCNTFNIACYQPYEINRALGFKTNWKKP